MGNIQSSSLKSYLASFKVDYVGNPTRSYKLILQDISAGVASKHRVVFASGDGNHDIASAYNCQGNCPNQGVHTNEGSVFIVTYDANRWQHKYVKPLHQ